MTQSRKVKNVPECQGCPLLDVDVYYGEGKERVHFVGKENNFVPPKYGTRAKRLVIAEAPGETESLLGEPLVGASGQLFDGLCSKAGVRRQDLTIINTINCRPPRNVFPTDSEARFYITKENGEKAVKQCVHNHVKPLLESVDWERVDLLGEKALRYVGGTDGGIYRWRGSAIEIDTEKL